MARGQKKNSQVQTLFFNPCVKNMIIMDDAIERATHKKISMSRKRSVTAIFLRQLPPSKKRSEPTNQAPQNDQRGQRLKKHYEIVR